MGTVYIGMWQLSTVHKYAKDILFYGNHVAVEVTAFNAIYSANKR